MKQVILKIKDNIQLTKNIYKINLSGDSFENVKAGQFINIQINEQYLRRPISVSEIKENELSIIYKVVGKGTEKLSQMISGETLDCLIELGNGYDFSFTQEKVVLIGGGVGIPPLYEACKQLLKLNKKVSVVLGFNNKEEVFLEKEFKDLGVETYVTTVDGTYGKKGYVTDGLKDIDFNYYLSCGPEPMLKNLHKNLKVQGQLSFEKRMGCGFGACMGCSCKTITGYKRICKEGPVLKSEEILWED